MSKETRPYPEVGTHSTCCMPFETMWCDILPEESLGIWSGHLLFWGGLCQRAFNNCKCQFEWDARSDESSVSLICSNCDCLVGDLLPHSWEISCTGQELPNISWKTEIDKPQLFPLVGDLWSTSIFIYIYLKVIMHMPTDRTSVHVL